MARFDVFNGDADGICALHQLRLADPCSATLITGAKRDIELLHRVQAQPGDAVTVCDISLDVNVAALTDLLNRGVSVTYFDHHAAAQEPRHPRFFGVIDVSPEVCTSALVDHHLGGAHRAWAVVAAFGDGMPALAQRLAEPLRVSAEQLAQLRELGELVNYNAYGDELGDLFFHPESLYRKISAYADPLRFCADEAGVLAQLCIYLLPDAAWARRLRGDLAHQLAQREPQQAHALLSPNAQGGYTVSVRAPLARREGADALCKQFTGGGGRAAAAGINHLDAQRLDEFATKFFAAFAP
jgi:hypothetical protein